MLKNENGLFPVLGKILKGKPDKPFTCIELYDLPEVRKVANSPNRVSDYLGNMWRKGDLLRLPAPRTDNSSARWMYQWKPRKEGPQPTSIPEIYTRKTGLTSSRPKIEISEETGEVTIELEHIVVIVRPKIYG